MEETQDYINNFDPEWYLSTYYGENIGNRTKFALDCFHGAFQSEKVTGGRLLDIGTGPIVHSVISASLHVDEIYLSDLTPSNLDVLKSWLNRERNYSTSITEYVLKLEHSRDSATDRNELIRNKVKGVIPINIKSAMPFQNFDRNCPESYDVITSCLCLETCAQDYQDYETIVENIGRLLKTNGYLLAFGHLDGDWFVNGCYRFKSLFPVKHKIQEIYKENNFEIISWKEFKASGYAVPPEFKFFTNSTNYFFMMAKKC